MPPLVLKSVCKNLTSFLLLPCATKRRKKKGTIIKNIFLFWKLGGAEFLDIENIKKVQNLSSLTTLHRTKFRDFITKKRPFSSLETTIPLLVLRKPQTPVLRRLQGIDNSSARSRSGLISTFAIDFEETKAIADPPVSRRSITLYVPGDWVRIGD